MKKTALVALVAACALVTAGCSSASQTTAAPAERQAAVAAPESAPATTELPAAEVDMTEYLRAVRASVRGMDAATDTKLVDAGNAACDQMDQGISYEAVRVVETSDAEIVEGYNSQAIASLASQLICPEHSIVAD